jgi:glyoxylase-like metal-dependent hydrolase (beta-lactamase superfamily II)
VSRAIDVLHLGRDRVICAYALQGDPSSRGTLRGDVLIVDPGPASCVDTLIDRLGPAEPRVLLLTHIHLDHAGAAGVLCRRYPKLQVYVHERGAPHLIDPSKLLESAGRLYGDDMWEVWGEVAPVPEQRIHALGGGETVEGFRVAYTPGHAWHHVCYLHLDSGDAYVGDMAGVRIPPYDHTIAPTPPPDIDVEAWLDSLHAIASWNPQSLCLTHFGQVTAVGDHLHRIRCALTEAADSARLDGEERFIAALEAGLSDATDPATVEVFEQAAPPDQLYQGLQRYWRKMAG